MAGIRGGTDSCYYLIWNTRPSQERATRMAAAQAVSAASRLRARASSTALHFKNHTAALHFWLQYLASVMLQVRQHSAKAGPSSSGPPGSAPRGRPEWRHGDLPRNLPHHRLPGREPFKVCVDECTVHFSISLLKRSSMLACRFLHILVDRWSIYLQSKPLMQSWNMLLYYALYIYIVLSRYEKLRD